MGLLINESVFSALEIQAGHERLNAHIYLYISNFLREKGLNNLAGLFYGQYDEELSHSKVINSFLVDMGGIPIIKELGEVSSKTISLGDSIVGIADMYLSLEVETTRKLGEILDLSIESSDYVSSEFLRKMIAEQESEYRESSDFLAKAMLCRDWTDVFMWDMAMGKQ